MPLSGLNAVQHGSAIQVTNFDQLYQPRQDILEEVTRKREWESSAEADSNYKRQKVAASVSAPNQILIPYNGVSHQLQYSVRTAAALRGTHLETVLSSVTAENKQTPARGNQKCVSSKQ
jgi:hypothetical protein